MLPLRRREEGSAPPAALPPEPCPSRRAGTAGPKRRCRGEPGAPHLSLIAADRAREKIAPDQVCEGRGEAGRGRGQGGPGRGRGAEGARAGPALPCRFCSSLQRLSEGTEGLPAAPLRGSMRSHYPTIRLMRVLGKKPRIFSPGTAASPRCAERKERAVLRGGMAERHMSPLPHPCVQPRGNGAGLLTLLTALGEKINPAGAARERAGLGSTAAAG